MFPECAKGSAEARLASGQKQKRPRRLRRAVHSMIDWIASRLVRFRPIFKRGSARRSRRTKKKADSVSGIGLHRSTFRSCLVNRREFLDAPAGRDFAGVQIALRIHG